MLSQSLIPKQGGGRALVLEVMVPTPAIRNLVREDKIHQIYSQMQLGQAKFGMQTANQSLHALFSKKFITMESALEYSSDPEELKTPVEGVVTTYNKPFSKADHDAITANIPVFGEVKAGRVVYANPDDLKNAAQVRLKDMAANDALLKQ